MQGVCDVRATSSLYLLIWLSRRGARQTNHGIMPGQAGGQAKRDGWEWKKCYWNYFPKGPLLIFNLCCIERVIGSATIIARCGYHFHSNFSGYPGCRGRGAANLIKCINTSNSVDRPSLTHGLANDTSPPVARCIVKQIKMVRGHHVRTK